MSSTTRSSIIARSRVPEIIGLTPTQVATLKNEYSIEHIMDIAILESDEHFITVLGNDNTTFLLRHKLATLSKFLRAGHQLTNTTSICSIG